MRSTHDDLARPRITPVAGAEGGARRHDPPWHRWRELPTDHVVASSPSPFYNDPRGAPSSLVAGEHWDHPQSAMTDPSPPSWTSYQHQVPSSSRVLRHRHRSSRSHTFLTVQSPTSPWRGRLLVDLDEAAAAVSPRPRRWDHAENVVDGGSPDADDPRAARAAVWPHDEPAPDPIAHRVMDQLWRRCPRWWPQSPPGGEGDDSHQRTATHITPDPARRRSPRSPPREEEDEDEVETRQPRTIVSVDTWASTDGAVSVRSPRPAVASSLIPASPRPAVASSLIPATTAQGTTAPNDSAVDIANEQEPPVGRAKRPNRKRQTPSDSGQFIGGGQCCNVEGCATRAQNRGLCWKHGGFKICTIDGCARRAKSRGICWTHGGGRHCQIDGCEKVAVSKGRCWAHGGGKRCKLDGCKKPATARMDDYCAHHYANLRYTR